MPKPEGDFRLKAAKRNGKQFQSHNQHPDKAHGKSRKQQSEGQAERRNKRSSPQSSANSHGAKNHKGPASPDKPMKPATPTEVVPKKPKLVNLTLDMFNNDVQAWFEAMHERADPSLTKLERGITGNKTITFVQTKMWNAVRKDFDKSKELPSKGGGPVALVMSASADRACIVAKELRKCPGSQAKLFARHMKVSEQREFLESHTVGVAVGTPNRVLKLCQESILKLDSLKVLVIDLAVDSKTFTILSLPEVSKDFFKFFREYIVPLSQSVRIVIVASPTETSVPSGSDKKKVVPISGQSLDKTTSAGTITSQSSKVEKSKSSQSLVASDDEDEEDEPERTNFFSDEEDEIGNAGEVVESE